VVFSEYLPLVPVNDSTNTELVMLGLSTVLSIGLVVFGSLFHPWNPPPPPTIVNPWDYIPPNDIVRYSNLGIAIATASQMILM
jgi:hypothetical protein